MTRCPIGARDERITDLGGRGWADELSSPASVTVLSVASTYADGRLPISAGVIHWCGPPQYSATPVFGVPPFTTSHTSAIALIGHLLITASPESSPAPSRSVR